MRTLQVLFLASVISVITAAETAAQTYQGGVRGAVRDSTGIIPSVTVTLINEGTNATRTSTTNDVGQYSFQSVQPGVYTLRAELAGFSPFEQTGIEVGVQRFVVQDIQLALGDIEESITVVGESPLLETATASRSSSLESEEMKFLPTPARNPFFLAITTAGVVPTGPPRFQRMQDQSSSSALSIAGGPRRGNNYTLDGVAITDIRNRAVIIPSLESLEEVKIQANTYDAEMGRTGGGVFNTFHRRGSNVWSGSALVQSRPNGAVSQQYFAAQAGTPKPDSYYWTWAGSVGGPIFRDKTFFWFATESYRTNEVVNTILHLPTAAAARGDFSQTGVTIYDPLTTRPDPNNPGQFVRDPFPGNIIPADRLNPVGLNLAAPLAARGTGDVSANGDGVNAADQFSFNISHAFNENNTLTGTYMYYHSLEPPPQFDIGGPSDPGVWDSYRRVHLVALNDTILLGNDAVVTLRYGYNSFDDNRRSPDFDVRDFGWSDNYAGQVSNNIFPAIDAIGYGWGSNVGGGSRFETRYYSHNVNGTVSKFIGSHTLKLGTDYRRIAVNLRVAFLSAGLFEFNEGFTEGPDPNNPTAGTGDSLASLLLGYPASGTLQSPAPLQNIIDYYGAFVHDDWRVSDNVVLNLGLRVEHETGLTEKNNRLTVGFDRETPWPVQPIEGMTLRGGLMYAGVDGYPEHQGDPTAWKWGPRAGFSWSLNESTVVRGGYGLFWAPLQPTRESARGFETQSTYFASNDGGLTPAGTITDPFPNGVEQPLGSSLGLLTGAGGNIDFADQFRKSPYVQQYSFEVQRELPGAIAVTAGYVGSRSERLGVGGTSTGNVNINQLDPRFAALGPALQQQVPNPFFGKPIFGNLSENETIARGQLLRPYPQFLNLNGQQMSEGKRRYHSLVLSGEKRFRGGWSFRANYVYSRNDDNVFGEGNSFSRRTNAALDNYDLQAEYGRSLSDIPHRLNISGIYELPFGRGRRWLDDDGIASAVLGGWSFSAIGFYQSGFPVSVLQSPNNTGLFTAIQRPNPVPGVEAGPGGSVTDNLDSYLNPDAWSQAQAFTFGDAPRTDTRVRTPFRKNWDIAFQKTGSVGPGNLTFRFEIINLFNTPSFTGPRNVWGRGNFGQIQSTNGFPRLLQIGFRYNW